ncbi:hypothetical protein M422DRAFT_50739 [Sphaerobolus stellatus SS14]|uniref:Uncharacterized protein n=1 Tax=Sphaerobolus stellatus (strain SS14) TaxID=990650 RepID=A0A0C9U2Q7_SPHS4|nr:hypothetical protein M422DRAFT_50739 [Sphaerobolus stellatus SS14]
MQLLSILAPILLAVHLVAAQSKPADGNYVILSRALSSPGSKLAMTFNQPGLAATISPFIPGAANQTASSVLLAHYRYQLFTKLLEVAPLSRYRLSLPSPTPPNK